MQSKLKILFFTHYSSLYGANKSLINLLEGVKNHGVDPLVILPQKGDLCKELERKGFSYVIHDFRWWVLQSNVKPKFRLNWIKKKYRLYRQIKNNQIFNQIQLEALTENLDGFHPNLIYSNSSVFNFGFMYARKIGIPHIWHLREVQEHYGFTWTTSKKNVKESFEQSDLVIAISSYVKQNYEKKYEIGDIKVLYDGVLKKEELLSLDNQRRIKKPCEASQVVFGIVGLIHPNKGQEEAIKAFAHVNRKFRETKLVIVGQGNQDKLIKLVKDLELDTKVEFWGHLENPFKAFLNIDVTLMCSRMEGMGRVTLESMAAATPVIGYKEGGTKELILENVNGLFYKKGTEELAEKMIFFIENENERKRMGLYAREIFEKRHTSEIYGLEFMNIVHEYLK